MKGLLRRSCASPKSSPHVHTGSFAGPHASSPVAPRRQRGLNPRRRAAAAVITVLLVCCIVTFAWWPRETSGRAKEPKPRRRPPVPSKRGSSSDPIAITLIMSAQFGIEDRRARSLSELLMPVINAEAALCYRRRSATATASPFTLSAVLVTDLCAAEVEPLVTGRRGLKEVRVAAGGLGGLWRAWTLDTAPLRHIGGVSASCNCFSPTTTIVSFAASDCGSPHREDQPAAPLAQMIDAGLRTGAGEKCLYFVSMLSNVVPTAAPYTVPDDVTETRRPPTGFIDALLQTLTTSGDLVNATVAAAERSYVAAASCAVVVAAGQSTRHTYGHYAAVPVPLSHGQLSRYTVVDTGGVVGSTATSDGLLLYFMSRHQAGLRADDQRVLWSADVDAASLFCGAFHKGLFDASGGFAAALADTHLTSAATGGTGSATASAPTLAGRPIHTAADSAGWLLALHQQRLYPDWTVRRGRALAVWQPRRGPAADAALDTPLYGLHDAYGMAMEPLLLRLQARRGRGRWECPVQHKTAAVMGQAAEQDAEAVQRPPGEMEAGGETEGEVGCPAPVIYYHSDYACTCCSLGRHAQAYMHLPAERFTLGTVGEDVPRCDRPGGGALRLSHTAREHFTLFGGAMSATAQRFWQARLLERPQVHFVYARPNRYRHHLLATAQQMRQQEQMALSGVRAPPPLRFTIGYSHHDFSMIPSAWVDPLHSATDEVWVPSFFFQKLYTDSGVVEERVRILPEAVDTYLMDPANTEPLQLPLPPPRALGASAGCVWDSQPSLSPDERSFRLVFLSVLNFDERHGWDVLLSAYWDAFGPLSAPAHLRNRTTLILKTSLHTPSTPNLNAHTIEQFLQQWAERTTAMPGFTDFAAFPHVMVVDGEYTQAEMTALYAAADVYVLPSRAGGRVLAVSEALAMGLPVMITNWGWLASLALLDFAFPIRVESLLEPPISAVAAYGVLPPGHKWAAPSRNSTATHMRYAVMNRKQVHAMGRRARRFAVKQISEEAVADTMEAHLRDALRGKVKGSNGT